MNPIEQQYQWVRSTREGLLNYCESIQPTDYVKQVAVFGWGSVRNLHVHVADCYRFWLLGFPTGHPVEDTPVHAYSAVADVRRLFGEVDTVVQSFLADHVSDLSTPISGQLDPDEPQVQLSPLWLLTHAMTHEFHHKGQLVTLTRHLGYTPPDTDLVMESE